MKFPVFDMHCDTALALLGDDLHGDANLMQNNLQIDLSRAGKLDGYCQTFACFTTPAMEKWYGVSPVVVFEKELEAIRRELAVCHDYIRQAYTVKDIEGNLEKGKMSAILSIEGPAGIDFDPELLEDLYKIGFRITSLGWNEQNILTGSNTTGGGLTDQGREYVREAQRVGMVIDTSHISDQGFFDIMDITEKPVVATHSNSRAVCSHSRNLTDEMFLEICKTGGVCGINLYTEFLGQGPDLDTVCDHIFHFMELDPAGTHIALGGDLDGCETLPAGFNGVGDYPVLIKRMLDRGLDENTVRNICWNNAMEVLKRCCM